MALFLPRPPLYQNFVFLLSTGQKHHTRKHTPKNNNNNKVANKNILSVVFCNLELDKAGKAII